MKINEKLVQSIPAALLLLVVAFRYFSVSCIDSGSCFDTWIRYVSLDFTKPLYFFALYSLPLAIILVFVSHKLFKSWLKLAVWLVPLLLLFIATQPVAPQSFMSTNRDDAARLVAELLTVVSLIKLILPWWKSRTLRKGA